MEETERFVDSWSEKVIAPANQWPNMSIQELIDTKLALEDKLWAFHNKPAYAKPLRLAIDNITSLIDAQTASGSI